jgi:hypothetical protein
LSSLQALYKNRNYVQIIELSKTASLSEQDSLLVGLSYLQSGQTSAAIQWLQSLQSSGGAYNQDADYYLAMAFVKNKEYEKALPLLQQIQNNRQHLYHKQVSSSLIWKLRMLQWK